jgi:hypothetical protein
MKSFDANPFAYIFSAVILTLVVGYYLYGALNRMGLTTQQSEGRVTGKNFAPGSTTYNTNIAGGRTWVQSYQQPDAYVIQLEVNGESTAGLVDEKTYGLLNPGDRVQVRFQRTRFSKQLLVIEVNR